MKEKLIYSEKDLQRAFAVYDIPAIRSLVVEIAQMWPGHSGINYETTTTKNLLFLIRDAIEGEHHLLHDGSLL